jgi:hypothetical protein
MFVLLLKVKNLTENFQSKLSFQGDVLRVDPSMIPKIFQVLYDSEGQILMNSSTTTMTNSIVQSQVKSFYLFI